MVVTETEIKTLLADVGIHRFGVTHLARPLTFEFYQKWIDQGLHGEMGYLALHAPQKAAPQNLLPKAKQAWMFAIDYMPHPEPLPNWPFQSLPVAAYAQGYDYHHWLKKRLNSVCEQLKNKYPEAHFLTMTDSHPVLERDLAHRAGLGWFGKNTCLIDQNHGSYFLIGEIFTNLEIESVVTAPPDMCGSCSRCIEACPTEAITSARHLDATRCISYWTIESRNVPPPDLRKKIGSWFFGCDICQQVCPWNEKAFGRQVWREKVQSRPPRAELIEDLKWVFSQSNSQLNKTFHGTALSRTGGRGLKRNAVMVAVHHQFPELLPWIKKVQQEHKELEELCSWAITELS